MKKLKPPTPAVANMWRAAFINDAAKFIGPTLLDIEDYHTEFTDENNEVWKILGNLEGKEMACEKLSTGEVFVWDRWKVSLLRRPERHAARVKNATFVFPETKKKRKTKDDVVEASQSSVSACIDELDDEVLQHNVPVEPIDVHEPTIDNDEFDEEK